MALDCDETNEDHSLTIYVFETKTRIYYMHHDINLPSFPFCAQSINFNPIDIDVHNNNDENVNGFENQEKKIRK